MEDLGVDGMIILKYIFKKQYVGMNWNDVEQDRERWRVVINAVLNLLFS